MHKIGLGTYEHTGKKGAFEIAKAIEFGYRLIDTADHYKNHKDIANAIKVSKIPRSDICICTKVWRDRLDYTNIVFDVDRFLNELQTNYIDILLIHWPNRKFDTNVTLNAFEHLKNTGLIKSYGVSNFNVSHLEKIKHLQDKVEYNQIEFHPSLNQKELKAYCDENNIKIMSHSGLGGGLDLKIPQVIELATKYKKTSAQILYSWLVNKSIIPIVGFDSLDHLKDNFASAKIDLLDEDVKLLNSLYLPANRVLIKKYSEF